jgi:hypothetical protein
MPVEEDWSLAHPPKVASELRQRRTAGLRRRGQTLTRVRWRRRAIQRGGARAAAGDEREEWRRAGEGACMRGWWPEAVRGGGGQRGRDGRSVRVRKERVTADEYER